MLKNKLKEYKETEKKLDSLEYTLPNTIKQKTIDYENMLEDLKIYSNIE